MSELSNALDEVDRAVARKSGAAVLDALLAAWRMKRAPELHDAIVLLSKRYEAAMEPLAGKTERTRYEQMLDLVAKKRAADVPRILAELPKATVIRAKDHMDRLGAMDPDPRVATALLDHVATRRYNAGNKVWTAIFREIRRHGDARTREALERMTDLRDEPYGTSLRSRVRAAIEKLPAAVPLDALDGERIAKTGTAIPSLELDLSAETPAAPPGRDEAALFDEMLSAPDDDAIRAVLADLYAARGEPRGELIQIQLAIARPEKPAAKLVAREKKLLKEHLVRFLGPLEPVVDRKSCRFARGFLHHAEVKFKTPAQRRELLGHPLFGTIESLVTREVALVRHPRMRALRSVAGLPWRAFAELAEGAPVPFVTRAGVSFGATDPGAHAIAHLHGLPALTDVSLEAFDGFTQDATTWTWILREAGGAFLKLGVEIETLYHRARLSETLALLDRHPEMRSLVVEAKARRGGPSELRMEIARAANGYDVSLRSPSYWQGIVGIVFDGFARTDTTVTIHPPPNFQRWGLPIASYEDTVRLIRARIGDRLNVVDPA